MRQVTFVVNMLTRNVSDQLAMLMHARDIGIPVNYIELGNEVSIFCDQLLQAHVRQLYAEQPDNEAGFPSAAYYATNVTEWHSTFLSQFPNAHISAVGREYRESDQKSARVANWTTTVVANSGIRSVTMHPYW